MEAIQFKVKVIAIFVFFIIIFVPLPSCVPVGQKGSIIANLTMRPLYENHN